jgi:hypothetical protein
MIVTTRNREVQMADPPPYPGTPRWVKISGIIAITLVLLFFVMKFTGVGGPHGPGRHIPTGDAGGTSPFGAIEDSTPPEGSPR